MSDNIEVSVYCLAYNHAKYIRKTLEGFVNQKTTFKYEVIVHDDASKDSTAEIIAEYAKEYPEIIKPIYQKENQYSQGVHILETHIFPRMQGRYVAICEGDDYWNDDYKLQKQYDALENHPECCLSTHKVKGCNEDGSPNGRKIPAPRYNLRETEVLDQDRIARFLWGGGGYPFHTSSYFYRKPVRQQYTIKENIWLARDIGLLRACMLNGSTYYIDEEMSTRRYGSVDGWNERLKKSGIAGRVRLSIGDSDAELSFDEFSGKKYHELIYRQVFLRMLAVSKYDPEKIKKYFEEKEITYWKAAQFLSGKEKIRCAAEYFLLKYLSFIWKMLGNLKAKNSN